MKSLSEKFNKSADRCFDLAARKGFLSFAFATGVVAMPFSTTAAAMLMAAPTIYAGFGLMQKGIAKTLEHFAPSNS